MKYHQYEIILVNFDPTIGSEIKKTRPCLILSPDEMNEHINTLVVAPMTSTNKGYPSRVQISDSSFAALEQIRTIDKQRVIKKLDALDKKIIDEIKDVLKEMLVD